jgi:cell division protease FtsH
VTVLPCYFLNRERGNANNANPGPEGCVIHLMTLDDYTSNYRTLIDAVARAVGITDPVTFVAGGFNYTLITNAVRGPLLPLDGVLTRDWVGMCRKYASGIQFGIRRYTAEGIRFARCIAPLVGQTGHAGNFDFFVVERTDYLKLYRKAVKAQRSTDPETQPPVLPVEHLEVLRQNTLGFLDRKNLARIKDLGGRAKRGILLTGPPGNGKTSACRWLWEECTRLGYEYSQVTPDAYRSARGKSDSVEAVQELFEVGRRGIIFFDDMDIALRDRNTVGEGDDQAVFLGALDGIEVNEGVVYVFTTNCPLSLIDPAFKRPGRIDVVLQFDPPNSELRRRLIERWHADVRNGTDVARAIRETNGFSFAEVEEVKNLLILRYLDVKEWDWEWAMDQFRVNRQELKSKDRPLGFAALELTASGKN